MSRPGIFLSILMILIAVSPAGCGKSTGNDADITATGTIQKPDATSYMYGTHTLVDDAGKTLYALQSDTVNLDGYIDRKVVVRGTLVSGYPVNGGPDFLFVTSVVEMNMP